MRSPINCYHSHICPHAYAVNQEIRQISSVSHTSWQNLKILKDSRRSAENRPFLVFSKTGRWGFRFHYFNAVWEQSVLISVGWWFNSTHFRIFQAQFCWNELIPTNQNLEKRSYFLSRTWTVNLPIAHGETMEQMNYVQVNILEAVMSNLWTLEHEW